MRDFAENSDFSFEPVINYGVVDSSEFRQDTQTESAIDVIEPEQTALTEFLQIVQNQEPQIVGDAGTGKQDSILPFQSLPAIVEPEQIATITQEVAQSDANEETPMKAWQDDENYGFVNAEIDGADYLRGSTDYYGGGSADYYSLDEPLQDLSPDEPLTVVITNTDGSQTAIDTTAGDVQNLLPDANPNNPYVGTPQDTTNTTTTTTTNTDTENKSAAETEDLIFGYPATTVYLVGGIAAFGLLFLFGGSDE